MEEETRSRKAQSSPSERSQVYVHLLQTTYVLLALQ